MTNSELTQATAFLADANRHSSRIDEKWAASNEQWWDWYMSLASSDAPDFGSTVAVPPLPELSAPSVEKLGADLDARYPLSADAVATFRQEGYVKLQEVCSPPALLLLRKALEALFVKAVGDAPAMRFPSLELMWLIDPIARAFATSRRLARIAADLLGVDAVRLYHDNALSKLPGCGRTPWHYDAHHYPIASENVVTLWMPLQPTPRSMGPLSFAKGIDTWRRVADLPFSKFDDSYDRALADTLRDASVTIDDGPFAFGEASFHHTRSLHTAGPNRTDMARFAIAITYLEDGARLVENPTLISGDYEKFLPGVEPGARIASALNPVVYDREVSS